MPDLMTVRPPLRVDEVEALQKAIADPAVIHPPASVAIGVSGGAPSERFVFMVQLDGAGQAEFRFLDEIAGKEGREAGFTVPEAEAARIFGLLEPMVKPGPRHLYDPDSLVGFVRVRAGTLESQTVFPVWEEGMGEPGGHTLSLPATGPALRIDPRHVPDGLTDLFAEMTSLVERHARA